MGFRPEEKGIKTLTVASRFAENIPHQSVLIGAKVPARSVIGVWGTGTGTASEFEFVVIGRKMEYFVMTPEKGEETSEFTQRYEHTIQQQAKAKKPELPTLVADFNDRNADWIKEVARKRSRREGR